MPTSANVLSSFTIDVGLCDYWFHLDHFPGFVVQWHGIFLASEVSFATAATIDVVVDVVNVFIKLKNTTNCYSTEAIC